MKKFLALFVALSLTLSFGAMAFAEEAPVELTIMRQIQPSQDMTNPYFDWEDYYASVEEACNVKLSFLDIANDDINEATRIVLASSDLPDIIRMGHYQDIKPQDLYVNGQIIDMAEYEECIPDYLNYIAPYTPILKNVYDEEGHLLFFCQPRVAIEDAYSGGLVIRRDWLDKLEMDLPETLDDWLAYLRAVKTTDLNGDGLNNEIPYWGDKGVVTVWMNYFGLNKLDFAMHGGLGGEVIYSGLEEERMKDALSFLHTLYEEELINHDYLTANGDNRDTLLAQGLIGSTWTFLTDSSSWNSMESEDPNMLFWGVTSPTYNGEKWFEYTDIQNKMQSGAACVTTSCENPEAALRMLNWFYTEEGNMLYEFGMEGVHYTVDEESGLPVMADWITNNPEGLTPNQAMEKYTALPGFIAPTIGLKKAIINMGDPATRGSILDVYCPDYDAEHNLSMPNLTYTAEELDTFNAIMVDVKTYMEETIHQYINGTLDVENYGETVEAIKSMGIETALEINRAAHQRWLEKSGIAFTPSENPITLREYMKYIPLTTEKGIEYLSEDLIPIE